jgi:hypothetical protein
MSIPNFLPETCRVFGHHVHPNDSAGNLGLVFGALGTGQGKKILLVANGNMWKDSGKFCLETTPREWTNKLSLGWIQLPDLLTIHIGNLDSCTLKSPHK